MNPMISKIASLPIDPKTGTKGKPLESGKGSRDFFSVTQRLMKRLLKELAENDPSGEINLSQSFLKIAELGQPRELEHAFSAARLENGELGLNRFFIKLMGIGNKGLPLEDRLKLITQDINSPTFSETIDTVKQDLRPVRDFLPDYLINQVGKQISRSILRGERVIKLQLKPPELGVLKVEMDIKGNILKLGIIAENSSIKELLLSNVHELREALVEQGVKLDRLDIQINYNSGQSLTNSKEGQGQELDGGPFIAEDDTEDPISGPRNMATGDHLLDLVA